MSIAFPSYAHSPATPQRMQIGKEMETYCLAWAGDTDEGILYYASLTERYPYLKAAWAAIMDGKRDTIIVSHTPYGYYRRNAYLQRPEGKGVYLPFWNDTPLQQAGSFAHLVLMHTSMLQPSTAQPFLHLSPDGKDPDLAHFFNQLDRALTLPLAPEWASELWRLGLANNVVKPLAGHNCAAWWITVDDEGLWAGITTQLHAGIHAVLRIETFGVTAVADDVATIDDGEGDDEE